jgi:hypothetical protein
MDDPNVQRMEECASYFSVSLLSEPYLCWIVREFASTPLPPTHSQAINEQGQAGYVNTITGRGSAIHPATEHFMRLIEMERLKYKHRGMMNSKDDGREGQFPDLSTGRPDDEDDDNNDEWIEFTSNNIQHPETPSSPSDQQAPLSGATKYYYNYRTSESVDHLHPYMKVVEAPNSKAINQKADQKQRTRRHSTATGRRFNDKAGLEDALSSLWNAPFDGNESYEPDILKFRSWWLERHGNLPDERSSSNGGNSAQLVRKDVEVWFDTRNGAIMLKIVEDPIAIGQANYSTKQAAVYNLENPQNYTKHDFTPSSTLTIGGRKTTLHQPSLNTQQWYDAEYGRLKDVLKRLEAEVLKYDVTGVSRHGVVIIDHHTTIDGTSSGGRREGGVTGPAPKSLRSIIEKCELEGEKLWALRPAILRRVLGVGSSRK